MVFSMGFAVAQERTVTGVVSAQDEGPLPGVNITIQGTTTGVMSGADGTYTIKVPGPNAKLVFSSIGYTTQEIEVGDQTKIDVVLISDGIMHLKKLETILIVVCFLSFVLFSVAGWVFAGRALKPIANVVKRVEDISFTSMNLRVPEGNGTDEIGKLAKTFNSMLERIQTSINVQKDFIANASHELRTPLTSINGQIEVLLLKNRSSDEYKNALKSVLDDIKSLTDLANKLLLMARTGPETRISYNNKIRTDEILWQIREEMKKYKPDFIINISFDDSLTDSDQMLVAGDEYLLKTAFSNIIENACKYSDDHSVEISLEQYFNKVHITFKDRGIGIDEKDLKMIFEPFYRASNAISIPGTGIGLSLVNQILRNHNGTIELTSVKSKGTTVKISLPSLLP
jgi:signal transduction histidine kinase